MENEELLRKIAENSEKSLKLQKFRTLCVVIIMLGLVFTFFLLVPRVISTVDKVNKAAEAAQETITKAQESFKKAQSTMDELDEMANSLTSTSDEMNSLITQNSEKITDSLEKMAGIDFDGLNNGIKDLQDAVGPLATFMKKFR